MRVLWQDLRYGLRMWRTNPGFAAVAVLTLALGIGVNSAIFTLVNAALLRPLPVREPGRLVSLYSADRFEPFGYSSYPDYAYYRDHNEVFDGLLASSRGSFRLGSLGGSGQPERLEGASVSHNYFSVLGVNPAPGRGFLPEEELTPGAQSVVIISHRLWQRRFGGDPDIIGMVVPLNGRRSTIVGVAPEGFSGTDVGLPCEVWAPIPASLQTQREAAMFGVVGRLKSGVSLGTARAAVEALARQLAQAYPETNRNRGGALLSFDGRIPQLKGTLYSVAGLLMAAVGVVLLIACANVANLMLARAAGRRREVAIRQAVGASRTRLVRQLLTESLLLAIVGGAAGILLALWTGDLMLAAKPQIPFPIELDLSPDLRVLGFTLAVSLLTGVIFGLAPAPQASKPDLVRALKDETPGIGRGERRFGLRGLLVVAQVALSLVLLVGAGLFLRSLWQVQAVDTGFRPENVLITAVDLGQQGYDQVKGAAFYQQILERVRSLPGVRAATVAQYVPLTNLYMPSLSSSVSIDGHEPPPGAPTTFVSTNIVGTGYFQALGIPLLRGRDFGSEDREGAPLSVVINEAMARRFWPGEEAVGRQFRSSSGPETKVLRIVGVARDSKYFTLWEEAEPYMYLPLAQHFIPFASLQVRTVGNPKDMLETVRQEVRALDTDLPIYNVSTMEDMLRLSLFPPRMGAALLGGFGLIALLLAAVGIYGVLAYAVSRRTREIGIRLALGAQPRDVLRMIVKESMLFVTIGVGCGLAAALAVTRLLASFLYSVSASDPLTFIGIVTLLTGVALLASWIPARRATRVDPLTALRHE